VEIDPSSLKVTSLKIRCPKCGSNSVAYSCEPDCCFNHVCEDCLESFQLATRGLGRSITGWSGERDLTALGGEGDRADSCAPTARCAKCHSLDVHSAYAGDPVLSITVCLACGALLELLYQ
jgi:hypothetical protein